jgi:hypothetical protein
MQVRVFFVYASFADPPDCSSARRSSRRTEAFYIIPAVTQTGNAARYGEEFANQQAKSQTEATTGAGVFFAARLFS